MLVSFIIPSYNSAHTVKRCLDSIYALSLKREEYEVILDKPYDKRFIFLKSWNEWGEGNYVEPDLKYGHGWLDALRNEIF